MKKYKNLNRIKKKIKLIIKSFPSNENAGFDDFTVELYQRYKEEGILILLQVFHKIEEKKILLKLFYEISIILTPKLDKDTPKKNDIPSLMITNSPQDTNKLSLKQYEKDYSL